MSIAQNKVEVFIVISSEKIYENWVSNTVNSDASSIPRIRRFLENQKVLS